MLINVRISELLNDTSNSIPLAVIIVISFNYPVYKILPVNMLVFNLSSFNGDYSHYLIFHLHDLTINAKISDYIYIFFNFFSNSENNHIMFVTSKF